MLIAYMLSAMRDTGLRGEANGAHSPSCYGEMCPHITVHRKALQYSECFISRN